MSDDVEKPRIRMRDVARRAGVSAITVSRVLSAPDKVAPETRAAVWSAVEALGYVPNLAAGTLKSQRSRIVAAIVPTLRNAIFAETVEGMADALRAEGYQLLLAASGYDPAIEEASVMAFLGRQPDGLILTGIEHSDAVRARLAAARLPVVETWDLGASPIDMLVGFSNYDAGAAITRDLARSGYRRIAFAGTEREARAVQRRAGYRDAVRALGMPATEVAVAAAGLSIADGADVIARLLAEGGGADAVFFANDYLAFGALVECQRRGVPVPGQLAIAGFGDFEIARESLPGLTTVRIPGYAIGREAAGLVMRRLAGAAVDRRIVDLGFEIVRRASA